MSASVHTSVATLPLNSLSRPLAYKIQHKRAGGPPGNVRTRMRAAPQSKDGRSSLMLTCIRKTLDLELKYDVHTLQLQRSVLLSIFSPFRFRRPTQTGGGHLFIFYSLTPCGTYPEAAVFGHVR